MAPDPSPGCSWLFALLALLALLLAFVVADRETKISSTPTRTGSSRPVHVLPRGSLYTSSAVVFGVSRVRQTEREEEEVEEVEEVQTDLQGLQEQAREDAGSTARCSNRGTHRP